MKQVRQVAMTFIQQRCENAGSRHRLAISFQFWASFRQLYRSFVLSFGALFFDCVLGKPETPGSMRVSV